MAKMNLLPWREERRKQRNRETGALLGVVAAFAVAAVVAVIWWYNGEIANQEARNQLLNDEITKVEAKIKEIEALEKERTKLLAKKAAIEELQADRSVMVHMFDTLVRTLPDGITLSSIKQAGDELTLDGKAESNARVATYMRNFETSEWIGNPELMKVEAKGTDKRSRYEFTLKVKVKKPKQDGATEGDGGGKTAPAGAAPATTPTSTPPAKTGAPS